MLEVAEKFQVRLGGNIYINTPRMIVYKGAPLFQLRRNHNEGMLEVDFDVFDASGRRVSVFRKGIVARGESAPFMITAHHNEYRVNQRASGRAIVIVKWHFGSGDLDVWLELYTPSGFLIVASPTETNLQSGGQLTRSWIKDARNGMVVE